MKRKPKLTWSKEQEAILQWHLQRRTEVRAEAAHLAWMDKTDALRQAVARTIVKTPLARIKLVGAWAQAAINEYDDVVLEAGFRRVWMSELAQRTAK